MPRVPRPETTALWGGRDDVADDLAHLRRMCLSLSTKRHQWNSNPLGPGHPERQLFDRVDHPGSATPKNLGTCLLLPPKCLVLLETHHLNYLCMWLEGFDPPRPPNAGLTRVWRSSSLPDYFRPSRDPVRLAAGHCSRRVVSFATVVRWCFASSSLVALRTFRLRGTAPGNGGPFLWRALMTRMPPVVMARRVAT